MSYAYRAVSGEPSGEAEISTAGTWLRGNGRKDFDPLQPADADRPGLREAPVVSGKVVRWYLCVSVPGV